MLCVLLATSDNQLRSDGRHYLSNHGYAVTTAADGLECVAACAIRTWTWLSSTRTFSGTAIACSLTLPRIDPHGYRS